MEFAVKVRGSERGYWVLAVDALSNNVLVTLDDQTLEWVHMSECVFMRAATPDTPRPVMPVQPAQAAKPGLALPNLRVGGNGMGR